MNIDERIHDINDTAFGIEVIDACKSKLREYTMLVFDGKQATKFEDCRLYMDQLPRSRTEIGQSVFNKLNLTDLDELTFWQGVYTEHRIGILHRDFLVLMNEEKDRMDHGDLADFLKHIINKKTKD